MVGILGRKSGMTTVFTEEGKAIPVTVIEVKPNSILQRKTLEKDGYNALTLGYEDKKRTKATKPELGIAKKAKTEPKYFIKEIRNMEITSESNEITVDLLKEGTLVDVTGTSKGKGFQGSIKRHNQSRGPMTHGSKYHRGTGSLGSIHETVKRTKKMPGHMGHAKVTMQNLEVILVNSNLNIVLIKGSIPGPNKSFVVIREAIKGTTNNRTKVVTLVDLKVYDEKNHLIEEGRKYNASLNSTMSLEDMQFEIEKAKLKYEVEEKEHKKLLSKALKLGINKDKVEKMKNPQLKVEIEKVEKFMKKREEQNG
ncbi:MAG: hypothetical protein HPAVJP_5270 [Candidatus Hepatoplasma vulgare]|nr:MAG: hypothetical protein HPAVJP_5270 [Candidatus Hepatoplasma sp.]